MSTTSVVIPSYENAILAESAILSCLMQQRVNIEIIVTDDSRSTVIEELVARISDKRIRYVRHENDGVPVKNWNFGLSLCTGQYVVLLHHDEYFTHELALAQGIDQLSTSNSTYIFGHEVHQSGDQKKIRSRWGAFLVRIFPSSLYFSNFVGSPSNVLFQRRMMTHTFRTDLKWLVDLEWIFVNFAKSPLIFSKQIDIISLADQGMSITKSLDVSSIEKHEVSILLQEHKALPIKTALIARLGKRYFKDFMGWVSAQR
jgi:glycosyltransferase involved in cell wall biosynthesis